MYTLKQLTRHVALYGLSSVVGRALHFLLVPLHTGLLTQADFGVLGELYMYMALLSLVYTLGLDLACFRFGAEQPSVLRPALQALYGAVPLLSGLLIVAAPWLAAGMRHPGCTHYFYYMAVILAFDAFAALPLAQLRLQQRAQRFVGIQLGQMGLNVGLNVLLLWALPTAATALPDWLPQHPITRILCANVLASGVRLLWVREGLGLPQRVAATPMLRDLLHYSLPLCWVAVAAVFNEMLPRFALKYFLPPGYYPGLSNEAVAGIFVASSKLALLMNLGVQAFRYAAEPFFFKSTTTREPKQYAQVLQGFVVVGCCLWVGISANIDWLSWLFLRQAAYRAHIAIVPYLLLGYLLLGMYYNLSVWFKRTRQTRYALLFISLGVGMNVLLHALLLPSLGYWACVVAQITCYGTMVVACYGMGQQRFPIPYDWKAALGYLGGTLLVIVVLQHLPPLGCAATILRGWGISLGYLTFVMAVEWQKVRRLWCTA